MLCRLCRTGPALYAPQPEVYPTLLGNQLRISKSLRASQGHHRYTSVCGAVQKYGRDNVVGQITGGWIPSIPLHRGVTRLDALDPLRVPCDNGSEPVVKAAASNDVALGSDTEPEEEAEEGVRNPVSPEDVSAWSDGEDSAVPSDRSGDEADEAVEEVSLFPRPWLLNSKTGWFHRAVKVGDDGQWCLACRPRAIVQEHYILHDTDPRFGGWTTCGHSGCRDS